MNVTEAKKTTVSVNDLTTDTPGLQNMLHSGRKTAVEIGTAAEAKITVGRRVFWNIPKIQKYLDCISEQGKSVEMKIYKER